jgi:hypothetical protein
VHDYDAVARRIEPGASKALELLAADLVASLESIQILP